MKQTFVAGQDRVHVLDAETRVVVEVSEQDEDGMTIHAAVALDPSVAIEVARYIIAVAEHLTTPQETSNDDEEAE